MNTFVNNYYSLLLDFIYDFKNLDYKGYTLSYFIHFPSLLRKSPIWNALRDSSIQPYLKNKGKTARDVQHVFNQYMETLKTKKNTVKNGKVVFLEDNLTRIPEKTYLQHFDVRNIIILKIGKKEQKSKGKLNIHYSEEYMMDNMRPAIVKVKMEAKNILENFNHHILYKEKSFQNILFRKIDFTINQIGIAENFLSKFPVSCLIISSPNHYGRIMAFVAAKLGIPTICLQHGIIANEFGYIPKIATIDAVYGHFEVDWYKKYGAKEDSLAIVGHPRFDQAFQKPKISKRKFYKKLKLNAKKPTVLLIVRSTRQIEKWELLIQTIKEIIDANFIIRDFPNDPSHPLIKAFPFIRSTESFQLYDILPNVDVVISYCSTVALESMLVNKPVFIMDSNLDSYTGYYNSLDYMVQKDPIKLAEQIHLYFTNDSVKKDVEKKIKDFLQYAYPKQTLSGKRLHELIQTFIN